MSPPNVTYFAALYTLEKSHEFYAELEKYPFESPKITIYGKTYQPLRKTASFADADIVYQYSGHVEKSHPWTQLLLDIKSEVEKSTQCSYNYVLVTHYPNGKAKIGAHRDLEASLDRSTPVATLSLGTTRTMTFAKKNQKSIPFVLESGSLLVMHDQVWTHAIPAQPDITTGRISLTFRQVIPTTTTIIAPQDSPSKRCASPHTDAPKHPKPDELPENDWLTRFIANENRTLKKFWLGHDLALSVQLFQDELCIHVRQHTKIAPWHLVPNKCGVCLNMQTFYEFSCKIFKITMPYTSQSVVFNNALLGLVKGSHIRFRQINDECLHPNYVDLNEDQFLSLKSYLCDAEEEILHYMFCERLYNAICCDTAVYDAIVMEPAFASLKTLVEKDLEHQMTTHFICNGCSFKTYSLDQHDCQTLSNYEKYMFCTDSVRVLCNIDQISEEYLKTYPKLSKDFNFEKLYKKLFSE